MSTFECKVYKLTISEHPNADAIELAQIGDYRSIVRKGDFKTGDLGVYIPTGAVLPEHVLQRMGMWDDINGKGKLAGKQGMRVKEIKLRGILSEGLIYPVDFRPDCNCTTNDGTTTHEVKDIHCVTLKPGGAGMMVEEGADVTNFLSITKYEPVIPTSMSGEVFDAFRMTLKFDIENHRKYCTSHAIGDVFEIVVNCDANNSPILPKGVELIKILDTFD